MSTQQPPSLKEVLSAISVSDGDPAVVTEYTMGLLEVRTRRRRLASGIAAVVVLATGATALTLGSPDDHREVVTPARETTSTTEGARQVADRPPNTAPPTTSVARPTTTTGPITLPTQLAPPQAHVPAAPTAPGPVPGPLPPSSSTRPPRSSLPPSTLADRPPEATLLVAPGVAGAALDLTFEFSDPDGPATKPTMVVSTDEPGSVPATRATGTGQPAACTGGPGTAGSLRDRVQFASTGRRRVTVTVSYCDAPPSVYSTDVDVGAPGFRDGKGRALMAEVPDWYPLAVDARWEFRPDGLPPVDVSPPDDEITHRLAPHDGFSVLGVVVVIPADLAGELVLVVPDGGPNTSSGTFTGPVGEVAPQNGDATRVRMTPSGPS